MDCLSDVVVPRRCCGMSDLRPLFGCIVPVVFGSDVIHLAESPDDPDMLFIPC